MGGMRANVSLIDQAMVTYMVAMSEWTTIMVRKETRERLKKLRIAKGESYDEV